MATYDEFWGKAGSGMLDLGVGLYNKNAAQKAAAQRLALAQGPLYQQAMGGAGATLGEAGGFNPDALAANRFNAGEALLKPGQDAQMADLQRMLYAKGMLGSATYQGVTPGGPPMNPQMAAFFNAQNADRAKRAQASLGEGQDYANNLVNRAGGLQRIASGTQGTGITAQNTQPSGAAGNAQLWQGVAGMFAKNPGMLKDIWNWGSGLFSGGGGGGGMDWFGGGGDFGDAGGTWT
ncbi:MAG: hypothetical protein Q7S17_05835 [Xanthobacteraceae bacterium]|nr:hypothetical protein [Xanthobacteraceae bacterium]